MKNKLTASLALALIVTVVGMPTISRGASSALVRYHVVTAPAAATNNSCLQNVMSYVDKGGVVGLIPNDITTNPSALNMPHVLRASEIIYSSTLHIWDAVPNPSGIGFDQYGQRLAWTLDYTDTTPFLASDVWFRLWSSDPANTLRFAGNVATNGTTPLTFSPTLRGELWDENGNKVATYYNGETVADHPINRLIAMIRLGYVVGNASELQLDLDYFRNQMPLTNFVAFYRSNGWGATNWISSRPFLTANPANGNGDKIVRLEGQRRLNLTYGIRRTEDLDKPFDWTIVAGLLVDGGSVTNTLPMAFYEAFEEGITTPPSSFSRTSSSSSPVLKVSNGPE